jgi:hypothetical protein
LRKGDYGSKTGLETEGVAVKGDDNWIHRDKLARIESEELQQATIRIHRQVRTGSKSSSLRGRSHDSHSLNGNVTTPPEQTDQPWPARHQLESPIPFEDSDEHEETERFNWDLRRPEEIAASSYEENDDSSRFYKSPGLKKSNSRIPVLASSPITVSPDQTERESSLQRIRTRTVGSGDEDGVPYSQSRRASESAVADSPEAEGSPEPADSTTPPTSTSRPGSRAGVLAQAQGSPTKKTPVKGTPTPTTRKSSVPPNSRKPSGPAKQRATSASSTKDRPVTRSGENRPPTAAANRPEGDPPWLATMYKPDPRLPPDQQLLPTHAKRMQQEQWEKEGKTPTTYDREFAPLAVRPDDDEPVLIPSEPEKKEETTRITDFLPSGSPSTWPLQPPKSPEPARPGTSGTNYSTMPKVQNTPPPIVLSSPQRMQANLPPPPEDEKVDKGCGCCIVM